MNEINNSILNNYSKNIMDNKLIIMDKYFNMN